MFDFASVAEALPAVERAEFDAIVTDLRMPGIDGIEGMRRFKAKVPEIPVILVTAFATVETAVEAMKAGAFDYLKKPFEPEELEIVVARAVEHARIRRENARLRSALAGEFGVHGIIGKSQPMKALVEMLERIAPSDVPILVEGECGTGKDLLARAAHAMSRRAAGPYVALNMSAIPENLAEAELFGHEKGAFTGAEQARAGFFAEADGGTLFLDEIGLLPPALQPKLLRVLQDGEYIPVGSRKPRKADVRVSPRRTRTSARRVKEGKFREDLWFRLRVVPLRLPPLRERREDIPLLVEHFVGKHALRLGRPALAPDAAAMRALLDHAWPGQHPRARARDRARAPPRARRRDHARRPAARAGPACRRRRPPAAPRAATGAPATPGRRSSSRTCSARRAETSRRRPTLAGLHRSTLYEKLQRYGLVEKDAKG